MKDQRSRLISRCFAIKNKLGLSDEVFADLKVQLTGMDSIKKMDSIRLRAFVAGLDRLSPREHEERPASQRRLSAGQRGKILRLGLGVLHWTADQVNGFLEKQTGKSNIDWLSAREAWNVTEALCAIIERRKDNGQEGYSSATRHKSRVSQAAEPGEHVPVS